MSQGPWFMGPQQDFVRNKVSLYSGKGKELACVFLQPFANSSTITLEKMISFVTETSLWQTEL